MFSYVNKVTGRAGAALPQPCTEEDFSRIVRDARTGDVCAQLRDLLEDRRRGSIDADEYVERKRALKIQLPAFCFHAVFGGKARKVENAVPSGLSIYDLDNVAAPAERWEQIRKVLDEKGVLSAVALVHITPSGEGLRIVFAVPQGMDIAQAQQWLSTQIGDTQFDVACKDLARCSFAVPEDYILYRDKEVLFGEAPTTIVATPAAVAFDKLTDTDAAQGTKPSTVEREFPTTYNGVPYKNIVDTLVQQLGGVPEHGSRNNFIFTLACHLRYLCDDNAAWLKSIIPTFGELRSKVDATVESACRRNQSHMMPAIVKRTLLLARMGNEQDITEDGDGQPLMPVDLPPLIELLLSNTPDIYKPAVAHAVFPALGAHLWRTRFCYIDNVEHEATLMNVLMAGTGAGKNCINEPIKRIMADIRARDLVNREREREWKEQMNTRSANKDKYKRPDGLVIQIVDPDMTNPAFVMRMAEAQEHFLYAKMNELDQFDSLRGNGRGGQQFRIMCLAFDPDNEYGQTRVGTQSVTERVTIRFNWNAATTVSKGQKYFSRVLTDGPISRINFCTIPEREIGASIPEYGKYTADFDERLRPYIENLTAASGLIDVPEAAQLAERLRKEMAEFSVMSGSRTFENLSFRANVIAWLKACVLYVAQGRRWDQRIEDFVRWSLKYDMWCKMRFFYNAIEEAENTAPRSTQRGPQNLLQRLPEEFTEADVVSVRLRNGMKANAAKDMIKVWKSRHYIEDVSDGRSISNNEHLYRKLKFKQWN